MKVGKGKVHIEKEGSNYEGKVGDNINKKISYDAKDNSSMMKGS